MSKIFVEKMRRLNKIIQQSESVKISFQDLSELMMEIFDANVYVLSEKGKVLGDSLVDVKNSNIIFDDENNKTFAEKDNRELMKITSTLFNITGEDLLAIFKDDEDSYNKYATIVPIIGSGQRQGTFIIARADSEFNEDELALSEYAATVIGLEMVRAKKQELEEENRNVQKVKMAIGTLSYSEVEAIDHIFNELEGKEGLLVASKIADRVGITRSVIVNALRKLESAGVIESRSLGMKGTFIRILNDKLREEFEKVKNMYSI